MADTRTFVFGPGQMNAVLTQYTDGTSPSVGTPVRLDVNQDLTLDFETTIKPLYGEQIYPVALGLAAGKVSGKIKVGALSSSMLNQAMFGINGAVTTGQLLLVDAEAHTIPATPYQVTVTHVTGWIDWGVRYSSTGLPLFRVASGPTTGQYSAAAGVYTFAAADTTLGVLIDYEYTVVTGNTVLVSNQPQGLVGIWSFRYQGVYGGRNVGLYLPNAVSNKFDWNAKEQDWAMPELDFEAFANPAGQVAYLYLND